MLTITLADAGKKYNHNWIFSGLSTELNSGTATALLGSNGSGKSTLLQVISSAIMPSRGEVTYRMTLRHFSSGMKQRVKLGLAILSDTPALLLDEPVTNLDKAGIEWYRNLIERNSDNRLILISSNSVSDEFDFCTAQIKMEDYKKVNHTEPLPVYV